MSRIFRNNPRKLKSNFSRPDDYGVNKGGRLVKNVPLFKEKTVNRKEDLWLVKLATKI